MDLSIRGYIKKNLQGSDEMAIRNSIEASINEGEEEALPGMGVLLEMLWQNSTNEQKEQILTSIKKGLK